MAGKRGSVLSNSPITHVCDQEGLPLEDRIKADSHGASSKRSQLTVMEARMYESLQLGGLSAVHAAVDDEAIRLQLLVAVCVPCHD